MIVINIASEVVPFAKTGGLADVAGGLAIEIQNLGHEVLTFLPKYKCVDDSLWPLERIIDRLQIPLGSEKDEGRVLRFRDESGAEFYLVDQPEFFSRDELYGTPMGDYPDNDRRFIFFQKAVIETLRVLKIKPDIIHCHDWQTGLMPVFLKTMYAKDELFSKTKTVFTIHNLGYQGNFPPDSMPMTGISWDEFKMEKMEFYGKVSFMKAGLVYSDVVTTVSERYSKEIQTEEFGCGLEGVLAGRRNEIVGIVNGLDYDEWNPETDPDLVQPYGFETRSVKAVSKKALQKIDELEVNPDIPIYGMISRLVDQKGIDILVGALDKFVDWNCQFVLLGTGEEKYHHVLREIGKKYRGRFGIHIVFDPQMAKRIYAGCDFMLVPSYYEPCGLAQMVALRYGTIPIVRETGGLADTVEEFNPRKKQGNGFVFREYSSQALQDAIERSLKVFQNQEQWDALVQNAMKSDYSWTASAKQYVSLYERVKQKPLKK